MSRDGYPRRHSGGAALLLLIAAAALVVAVLAIFTDVFSGKKAPDKDTDSPAVTQPADGEPDGTGDADNTAKDPDDKNTEEAAFAALSRLLFSAIPGCSQ